MTFTQYQYRVLLLTCLTSCSTAWISSSSRRSRQVACDVSIPDKNEVVDADFEKKVWGEDSKDGEEEQDQLPEYLAPPKTLMDASLDNGDPRWKETRIPFCRGDEYIDGKLAFLVELEGTTYGIGTPFDDAVAIVEVERAPSSDNNDNGKRNDNDDNLRVTYIDPDNYDNDEDSQELMEVMAKHVQESLRDDLVLRKTPKVLTISGGLSEVTDNWEQSLVGKPLTVEELMEDHDEDVDKAVESFYEFMRQELGQEEFDKTMKAEMTDEEREFAKYFDVDFDNIGTIDEIVAEQDQILEEAKSFHPDTDGVALKLIAFEFKDKSKSYQLVKLLQPYPLVGKQILEEADKGVRFELLTPDEEKVLIPKLEEYCRDDLTEAGMSLIPNK
eukprot:scaffold1417_cov113-Cylindrotheca_fusiformis.AAC.4